LVYDLIAKIWPESDSVYDLTAIDICWSLEWTSPVDELWKHLNPPSADYIETNVLKTKALQKTAPAGQAVATFKPKTRCYRSAPRCDKMRSKIPRNPLPD
jgi:hypothetical protein